MMKRRPVPVDRGWAWLVMVGAFFNVFVCITFIRSLSIIFPVFLEKYQQSVAFTTLAFGIAEIMESLANVLIPLVFLPRFTVRTLCVGGAIFHAAGIMTLAAASSNLVLVNVLFGCIGFTRAFMLNSQVYILGHYFKNRLSFANACANMGVSAGTLLGPLACRFLLDAFEMEWTFMMIGAFSLHAIPASLLLRPMAMYDDDGGEITADDADDTRNEREMGEEKETDKFITTGTGTHRTKRQIMEDDENENVEKEANLCCDIGVIVMINKEDTADPMNPQIYTPVTRSHPLQCNNNNNISSAEISGDIQIVKDKTEANGKEMAGHRPDSQMVYTFCDVDQKAAIWNSNRDLNAMQSQSNDRSLRADDSLNRVQEVQQVSSPLNGDAQQKNASSSTSGVPSTERHDVIRWLRRTASNSICTKPVAVLLIIASGLGVHTQAGNVYLPVLGLENGLTDDQLPWLLTITGSTDIVGKLVIGLLADKSCLPPLYIGCLSQMVSGVSLLFAGLYQGMPAMATLSVLYGLTAGILHVLLPTLVVQMVGLASLPRIISGYFLVNCVVTFVMHLVVGSIRDSSGSFVGGFQFVGCLFLASIVTLLLVVPVSRKTCRQEAEVRLTAGPADDTCNGGGGGGGGGGMRSGSSFDNIRSRNGDSGSNMCSSSSFDNIRSRSGGSGSNMCSSSSSGGGSGGNDTNVIELDAKG